jgi:NADH:quinone reductase (non-electrogenic)
MKPRKKTRIVIAGGGFAGLYAAKHFDGILARRTDIEVTLISRENFIVFTPMLHEVAAGDLSPSDIVNPLRRILRRNSRCAGSDDYAGYMLARHIKPKK